MIVHSGSEVAVREQQALHCRSASEDVGSHAQCVEVASPGRPDENRLLQARRRLSDGQRRLPRALAPCVRTVTPPLLPTRSERIPTTYGASDDGTADPYQSRP
jgi:hypothetical protein